MQYLQKADFAYKIGHAGILQHEDYSWLRNGVINCTLQASLTFKIKNAGVLSFKIYIKIKT